MRLPYPCPDILQVFIVPNLYILLLSLISNSFPAVLLFYEVFPLVIKFLLETSSHQNVAFSFLLSLFRTHSSYSCLCTNSLLFCKLNLLPLTSLDLWHFMYHQAMRAAVSIKALLKLSIPSLPILHCTFKSFYLYLVTTLDPASAILAIPSKSCTNEWCCDCFYHLPIFSKAGSDLNMVNPKPALNNALRIPPRKPPIPFLFYLILSAS